MTPEERAKRAVDAMAKHWSDYNYDEIVAQFMGAIKAAIEEEREACAKVADDYVVKADELKRKIGQQREGPTAAFQTAEDAPMVDAKIAIARLTSQKLAEAIRSRVERL
jgi:hypothetical protein